MFVIWQYYRFLTSISKIMIIFIYAFLYIILIHTDVIVFLESTVEFPKMILLCNR